MPLERGCVRTVIAKTSAIGLGWIALHYCQAAFVLGFKN